MSVNLIAKKRIGFRNRDTGEILAVKPLEFSTCPDWIQKDPMFKWAVADGTIEVSGDVANAIEKPAAKKKKSKAKTETEPEAETETVTEGD